MRRFPATLGAIAALTLTCGWARAQTIAAAQQVNAERFIGGQDVGQYTRPQNLNPLGLNYADCVQDMQLQFTVTLSGFGGSASPANTDNMQIWASYGMDCSQDTARGLGGAAANAAVCWLVNPGEVAPNLESPQTRQYTIPVRALVGPENGIPVAGTLVGDQGPEACTHQASFAAVPITIYFLPLTPSGTLDGTGFYMYPSITADLVGPPAPAGVSIGDGDTLFIVNWTPNTDADTQGYDVFIDPPAGSHVEAGTGSPRNVLYCPDAGVTTSSSSEDASDDSGDATTTTSIVTTPNAESPDACILVNGGGTLTPGTGGMACNSVALSASPIFTVGAALEVATDDSGVPIDSDAAVETGIGGIANLPCAYLANASCSSDAGAYTNTGNPSVTGLSASTLTISGLTNNVTYNIVVAAVDGSGNLGPQSSPEVCDYPAPVNDFFKTYKLDGGGAGGGFCALDAVGASKGTSLLWMASGALAFGLGRRRRKGRR